MNVEYEKEKFEVSDKYLTQMYVSIFYNHPVKDSIWMRIKRSISYIFKGEYYRDQIILNEKSANDLCDFLNRVL